MAPPKDRKRKFHRRSKNGCQRCKIRHVRCDEKQPLCTYCLQTGSECIYPPSARFADSPKQGSVEANHQSLASASELSLTVHGPLSEYVGGSFETLPKASRQLLRYFARYAVLGEQPVARELTSSVAQRTFESPIVMDVCLMLSACQWAWATGSMDAVRVPFLYHKAATYQYVRQQLLCVEKASKSDIVLAISALALAEGAIGDLDTSTKHLKGFMSAVQQQKSRPSLPQSMLKKVGNGLRTRHGATQVDVPDFQPTFMALLFTSIWDLENLPPLQAPKYGWWEKLDTEAARLWQSHTKDLHIDYEISRDFDPNTYKPRILNGDPKSSRASFIATFLYLFSEAGDGGMDIMLLALLLEQLAGELDTCKQRFQTGSSSGPLWIWCAMFGAALVSSCRARDATEEDELFKWQKLYDEKIKEACIELDVLEWKSTSGMMSGFVEGIAEEDNEALRQIWERSMGAFDVALHSSVGSGVVEIQDDA